jgi:hypothetical protein
MKLKKDSPASDAPNSPQPTSPKCSSRLSFNALKMSLLDISWGQHRNGGMRATQCRVRCRGNRDESDKEPAVLVYGEYLLVSIIVERQD